MILPLALRGRVSGQNTTFTGTLKAARRSATKARSSAGRPASGVTGWSCLTISIDALGQKLKGRVASFSPGTGASFALLPAENATGNWVKVVQRLPVRLTLDESAPQLSAGLSAKVTVDVRSAKAAR